jgi:hypothetical protein
LFRLVEAGEVDWIIIESRDRFGVKNNYEFGYYITLLRRNDVELWSAADGLLSSDDAYTQIVNTVGTGRSQDELKVKGERSVSKGMELGKQARYLGGHVPYGFDVVCYGKDDKEKWRVFYEERYERVKITSYGTDNEQRERYDGKGVFPAHEQTDELRLAPTIDPHRREVVKQIFHWYATEAITLRGLATRLNDMRIDPVYGVGWYSSRLGPMLRNPAYVGLPTWNKKGHGKAVEWVGGGYQEVPYKKGKPVKGRKRDPKDHAVPHEEYRLEGLVDEETWKAVQEKLDNVDRRQKAPRNPELWLAGLLYCGKCGQRMVGWHQEKDKWLRLSYTCYNYRTYGKNNPTGCRLHRVKSDVLEQVVEAYCAEAKVVINAMIEGGVSRELVMPLLEKLGDKESELFAVLRKMQEFVRPYLNADQLDQLGVEGGIGITDAYESYFQRERERLEKEFADKQAELERLIDNLGDIPADQTAAKEIAKKKIAAVDAEVRELDAQLEPLAERQAAIYAELATIDNNIAEATEALKGNATSRKAEAVRKVIDKMILHFRYTNDKGNKPSSVLDWLEVVPVAGNPSRYSFQNGMWPGPG